MKFRILVALVILFFSELTINGQGIHLSLKVYLQGALTEPMTTSPTGEFLMHDNLRQSPFDGNNYIPTQDPYYYAMSNFDITAKFNHVEPKFNQSYHNIMNTSVFDVVGQNAIVDWVFVEIRDQYNPKEVIGSRSGLLQRDGNVVDLDGVSRLYFPELIHGNYYVSIRHRSHLGVMTNVVSSTSLIDFTNPWTSLYNLGNVGNNLNYTGLSQFKNTQHNFLAMWGGDFNCDGMVKCDGNDGDMALLQFDVFSYPSNASNDMSFDNALGYFNSDFDMNSKIKYESPNDDKNKLFELLITYQLNEDLLANFNAFIQQLP